MTVRRRILIFCSALLAIATLLPGCAGLGALGGYSAPRVNLAGIDSLPGEGLELRFLLKLRVQNPGDADLHYDGIWVEVELRGQPLASGGAPLQGVVPRFGETVVMVPVTASGFSMARQAISLLRSSGEADGPGPVTYALRGRLGGTGLGGGSFESSGEIDLRVP
ncbi:MAG: LEA type 2 family protein [Burkholderiales bacterium]|nr:LEA type 2 family protein [Burkholderiales bacterium]